MCMEDVTPLGHSWFRAELLVDLLTRLFEVSETRDTFLQSSLHQVTLITTVSLAWIKYLLVTPPLTCVFELRASSVERCSNAPTLQPSVPLGRPTDHLRNESVRSFKVQFPIIYYLLCKHISISHIWQAVHSSLCQQFFDCWVPAVSVTRSATETTQVS